MEAVVRNVSEYRWLEDDEWKKLLWQFRTNVNETLSCFDMYGMGSLIPGAVAEIEELFVDGTQKVRGADKPFSKIIRIPRVDK